MKIKTSKQKIILVIEDERPLLAAVKKKLEKSNFAVIAARSVDEVFSVGLSEKGFKPVTQGAIAEALQKIERLKNIDAIWLDHNLLGEETGIHFVEKLKANGGRFKKVPIFVVSNSENPELRQSYTALGISTYYLKSNHRLDEIITSIHSFLDTKKT